jgi:hypothetical protein
MSEFLFQYHEVKPTTWVYLSSLLMIGLYFKFARFWSLRNLDLILLILLSPGLLLVHFGKLQNGTYAPVAADGVRLASLQPVGTSQTSAATPSQVAQHPGPDSAALDTGLSGPERPGKESVIAAEPVEVTAEPWNLEHLGFIWLFTVSGILLVRLLMDPAMSRRPLLEPNLSAGGLAFIGCSLFIFLMANVIADSPDSPRFATTYVSQPDTTAGAALESRVGYPLLWKVPVALAKTSVIVSHLAVVLGIVAVGYRHFANTIMGIGAAALYLMLPYTALLTGRIDHVLPAALLVWGIACYRQPLLAGLLIGAAGGLAFFPILLLPLWMSFYWQRGLMRFLAGWLVAVSCMAAVLVAVSSNPVYDLRLMFGLVPLVRSGLTGIWNPVGGGWDSVYQWPIVAAHIVFALSLALWPAQKNLGTLLSCSAALMLAAQYWKGHDGGIYMAWYLPMVLLTIFRPNLEDRVALAVLGERRPRLRRHLASVDLAA